MTVRKGLGVKPGGAGIGYSATPVTAGAASGAPAGLLSSALAGASWSVLAGALAVAASTGVLTTTGTAGSSGSISGKVRVANSTDAIETTIGVPIYTPPAPPVFPSVPSDISVTTSGLTETAAWGDDFGTVGPTPATLLAGQVGDKLDWTLTDDGGGFVQEAGAGRDHRLEVGRKSWIGVSSFTYRLRPIGVSGLGVEKSFTYTVGAASTTPASVSVGAPAAAARFDNASLTAGSSVGTIAAAWSANSGVAAGGVAPVARAYGPIGQTVAAFEADAAEAAISTPVTTSGAWEAQAVLNPQANAAINLLGGSTNTANIVQFVQNTANQGFFDRVTIRDNAAAALTNITLTRPLFLGRFHHVRVLYDNSVLKIYVDGVLSGTSGAYATKVFTFSKVGRIGTVTTTGARFLLGFVALWNGTLSAGDVTATLAYFEPWRRQQVRVSALTGSNASTTFAIPGGTPLATPQAAGFGVQATSGAAQVNAVSRGKGGDRWAFERGSVFTGTAPLFNADNSSAAAPYVMEAFGTGALPLFQEVAPVTSGWTNNGDATFTRAWANASVYLYIANGAGSATAATEYLRPVNRALTQDNSYQISGGNITVRPGAGLDLNATSAWLVYNTTATRGFMLGNSVVAAELYDLAAMATSSTGMESFSTTLMNAYRLRVVCSGDDGFGTNAGTLNFYSSTIAYTGPGDLLSGQGDGFAGHGTAVLNAYDCDVYGNRRGGFRHTGSCILLADGCRFWASWDPIQLANLLITTAGQIVIRSCEVRVDDWADPANPCGLQVQSGCSAGTVVTIEHNTFVNQRAGTSKWDTTVTYPVKDTPASNGYCYGADVQSTTNAYALTMRWNVVVGFAFDLHLAGSGVTAARSYNRLWNTAHATGAGYDADASTTTGDPGFTNAAANDFTPTLTSPLLAAATGSTSTRDRAGRTRPYGYSTSNTGAIGAYERAA